MMQLETDLLDTETGPCERLTAEQEVLPGEEDPEEEAARTTATRSATWRSSNHIHVPGQTGVSGD